MDPDLPTDTEADPATLEELRLCRAELLAVRAQLEADRELIAAGARAEEQLIKLSTTLDSRLTKRESRSRWWGPLRPLIRPKGPSRAERAALATLRASDLFDGPWYFQTYPATARSGLSAGLHYLRRGALSGKDPGPDFDGEAYRRQHPELTPTDNPLLHHLRSQAGRRGTRSA